MDLQKQQRQTKEQISTRISRLPNPEKITELAEQVSVLKKELTLKTQRIASLHQQLKSLVEVLNGVLIFVVDFRYFILFTIG